MPDAVTRGSDGYLRVYYDRLGLKFRTYRDWLAAGAQIPSATEDLTMTGIIRLRSVSARRRESARRGRHADAC